jgi:protein CMS1
MAQHRGDDLDDDFMPDETLALSDDDRFIGDNDDIANLLSADEDEVDTPKEQPDPLLEKKRRRREKEKERRAKAGSPFSYPKHELA